MRVNVVVNPAVSAEAAEASVREKLPQSGYLQAQESISRWDNYKVTPLVPLPDVAERLGVASVEVKDESGRMGLGSFKALGGAYAVRRAFEDWRREHPDDDPASFTVTCVTDGNHGLSVAWGANQLGCRCVIYVPDVVTELRENAIRAHGADVVRRSGNYDEVTVLNIADAEAAGWHIVTDTAPDMAAAESATVVMQGYRVLAEELLTQMQGSLPTHVFLQAGCGGMAASIVGHFVSRLRPEERPDFVIVEPENAACLLESAKAGKPVRVEGELDTIMAGLSVGEISLPAWDILQAAVRYFVTVSDDAVPVAMRLLARPAGRERPVVVSGETGAAGLAALIAAADNAATDELGLTADSRVLLLSTEGDTDPELYKKLVGEEA